MSATGGQEGARESATRRILKHVLVREHVREVIRDAEPGTPTPSERELVAQLGVARMTVRQALEALVVEGVLERQPGRGTFVAERPAPQHCVIGYSEEAQRAGLRAGGQTLVTRFIEATPAIADLLGTRAGERVMQWERLRFTDGMVTTVQMIYLNPHLLPDWPIGSPPTSLYEELEQRDLRPTSCEDVLKPSEATPREAGLLQISTGAPVLRQQRRTESWGRTVEVSSSVHRFDRFRLRYRSGS